MSTEQKNIAIAEFGRRTSYSKLIQKIDNNGLHGGAVLYFYCEDCNTPTEVLPEKSMFATYNKCSQCKSLEENGWLEEAKKIFQKKLSNEFYC